MRREFITKSTSGGCGQFETSPEEIEQEMLTALCERRQTDRLKTNYRVDDDDDYADLVDYVICDFKALLFP